MDQDQVLAMTDRSLYIDVGEYSRVLIRKYEEDLERSNRVFWEWENSGADFNFGGEPSTGLTLVVSYSSLFLTSTIQGTDYGFVNFVGYAFAVGVGGGGWK
jgi:hypothetical protein